MLYDVLGSIKYLEGRKKPKELSHFMKNGKLQTNAEAIFELKKLRDQGVVTAGGKELSATTGGDNVPNTP